MSSPYYKLALIGDQRALKSLSPRMHNHVLKKHGLAGEYGIMAVEAREVEQTVRAIAQLDMRGANVTVPHKLAVMGHLNGLSELARRIGAVNTIINDNGRLMGDNTDAGGFIDALAGAGFDPKGKTALLVGAGGASRALIVALVDAGADLYLCARRDDQALELAVELGGKAVPWAEMEQAAGRADLLVNAAAVSAPNEAPELAGRVAGLALPRGGLVCDINYGRTANFWRDLARARDCAFIDGLPMLVHQARRSFEIWTGIDAPAADFFEALDL